MLWSVAALLLSPALLALPSPAVRPQADLPRVLVERDDLEVTASCVLVFPDRPLVDAAGDGVVRVRAAGDAPLRVEFEGLLRGAPEGAEPDTYTGLGIAVSGPDVTLVAPRVAGFKVGVEASGADRLTVVDADVSDNFRQRLGSTWEAEDPADWLSPHRNDDGRWKREYGAGLVVERSSGVRVERLLARDVQNGILLDRVTDSVVTRCDASYLSGWGCALWRSSRNRIEANRFDFCVRGYSHGRYNRGQDSAGLLMFEQCSENVVRLNSITHGGDGVFGFAGVEALGQEPAEPADYGPGRGSNGNLFERNDLSFAPAHGLELTFSFGNRIVGNLFERNAICGLWLGYGRRTTVLRNTFLDNGDAGYGSERGAVNAEHARGLSVNANRFEGNAVGVRIWTDEDAHFRAVPWARANGMGARDNRIVGNRFGAGDLRVELIDAPATTVDLDPDAVPAALDAASRAALVVVPSPTETDRSATAPDPAALRAAIEDAFRGDRTGPPRPERRATPDAGRAAIVMTEWGPYDWTTPYVQPLERRGDLHRYRLLGPNSLTSVVALEGGRDIELSFDKALPRFPVGPDGLARGEVRVRPKLRGRAIPYRLVVRARGADLPVSGLLFAAEWDVRWFASPVDPREDPEAWRAAAETPAARARLGDLALDYGMGGPADLARARGLDAATVEALTPLGGDRFGTLAATALTLPPGTWRLRTRSDDGLRVTLDGEALIEDWTWHAPKTHAAEFTLDAEREVRLGVEHFELDGYSTLELELSPAD